MGETHAKAAFFDVDGTIISTKSLVSFARFLAAGGSAELRITAMDAFLSKLGKHYRSGLPRSDLNRFYFGMLRGLELAAIERAARQWYAGLAQEVGFYIPNALQDLDFFKSRGYRIVLVSGSFAPLLTPLRERVPYDDMLCTTPEYVDGRYTGELIGKPCIGTTKRDAVLKYALRHRISLQDSWAFGDDDSDLPMLDAVGNGVRTDTDESTLQFTFPA